VSYGQDGRLVSCGRDNAVSLWDGNGSKVRNMESGCDLPLRTVFSNDGKRIFATDFPGEVKIWTASDGKVCGSLNANPPAAQVATAPKPQGKAGDHKKVRSGNDRATGKL
jgi:WD40 repeat protein